MGVFHTPYYFPVFSKQCNWRNSVSVCDSIYLMDHDLSGDESCGSIPHCPMENIGYFEVLNIGRNGISSIVVHPLTVNCDLRHFRRGDSSIPGQLLTMEEDKKTHFLKMQRTRKLNCPFPIKLLQENFDTPSIKTGVPFSCDRIPANSGGGTYQTPPTPPPSSRWHPSAIEQVACTDIQLPNCVVDGFGGNDIFSVAETTQGLAEKGKTCSTEEPDDANQSPDFVIQRFLPDAQPLAAASLAQKKLMFSSPPSSNASFSRPVGASNVKGCGFRSLCRSLMKPKGRTPPRASTKDSTNRAKKC